MIEPKAKAFYLELADLMDRHGVTSIEAEHDGYSCGVEVVSAEFRYYDYPDFNTPNDLRGMCDDKR